MILAPFQTALDATGTLEVFLRAIRETASADYTPEQIAAWAPIDIDPAEWQDRRATSRTCVARDGGRVIGFTDVDDSGYIDMLFVEPEHARRGVASALMGWVFEVAARQETRVLTTHASITARPFFESRGFRVENEQHPVLRGVVMTNFLMSCAVARGEN